MYYQRNKISQNPPIRVYQEYGAPSPQIRNNYFGNNNYQQGGHAQTQQHVPPNITDNIQESIVDIQYEQQTKKQNQYRQNDKPKQNSGSQQQFDYVVQNTDVNNGKQSNPDLAKLGEAYNKQRQNNHQSQNLTASNQSGQIPQKGKNPFRPNSLEPKKKTDLPNKTTEQTDPYQMQTKAVTNPLLNVNKNEFNNIIKRPGSRPEVKAETTTNTNTQTKQNNLQPPAAQYGNAIYENQLEQETSKIIMNRNIADMRSPNRITTVAFDPTKQGPVFSSKISSNQQPSSLREQQQIQGNPNSTSKVTSAPSGYYPQVVLDTTPTHYQKKTDPTIPQSIPKSSPRFNEVKQEKNQNQAHLQVQGQIGNNNSQASNSWVAPSHDCETPNPPSLIQNQQNLQTNVEKREKEEFFIVYEDETPTKAEQIELNEQITPKSSGKVYTNIVYSNKLQSALEDLLRKSEKKVSYNLLRQQQEESKENAEQVQERNKQITLNLFSTF